LYLCKRLYEAGFNLFELMLWQKNGRIENLIDNLKSINQRIDTGNLWENFIVSERRKQLFCRQ